MPTPEVKAAIAERMNRLTQVRWDRCTIDEEMAFAFGWIDRPDGRFDYVQLDFRYGTTTGFAGESVPWFAVGFSTSSAEFTSAMNDVLELGDGHTDCVRVEDVFGEAVNRAIHLDRDPATPSIAGPT